MRPSATRFEQGWRLLTIFVLASLLLHSVVFYSSRGWSLFGPDASITRPGEVEVTLGPAPEAPKPAAKSPAPKPAATPAPKAPVAVARRDNNIPVPFAPKPVPKIRGVAPKDAEKPVSKTETSPENVEVPQPLPAPTTRPPEIAGGKLPDRELTPLPLGVESGDRLATLTPQPRVLKDVPPDLKPVGPQDIKSGSGSAPGPQPTAVAKVPDTETLPAGNNGSTSGTGNPQGTSVGNSADEGETGAGMKRGLPFGDPGGVLQGGDPNGGGGTGGGPGGPGTGGAYSTRRGGGAGAPIHVVYILDVSGSMKEDNKIGKAKEALNEALQELSPQDTFNIVFFSDEAYAFSRRMVPATRSRVTIGSAFVDNLRPRGATNYSAALTLAFGLPDVTHIVLMSDGEPTMGVGVDEQTMVINIDELLRWIRGQNTNRARILTMALGAGKAWEGADLLKEISQTNNGTFRYIDLNRR